MTIDNHHANLSSQKLQIRFSLIFLVLCSLSQIGCSLVTGTIQVKTPRIYSNNFDNDVSTCNADEPDLESSHRRNTTQGSIKRRKAPTKVIDYRNSDENDRRKLQWIVRSTSLIMGPNSKPLGAMKERDIKLAYSLMRAWATKASKRESNAPHVVERLLQRLLKERDAGNERVRINAASYNIVLDAWSYSSEEGSAERAEEILLGLERGYREGAEALKPDEGSYNAVVKAYVKNGSRLIAAPKAEAILNRMENSDLGVSPTRRSYNLVLYALANSSLEDSAERAEATLHRMLERYKKCENDSVKPDINSFNQVLSAWARGRHKNFETKMQSIYEELLELPEEMGIQPNTDTFNAVMGGWLKSSKKEAMRYIESTLATMETRCNKGDTFAHPDRVTINTVTAAYAKSGNEEAIDKSINLRNALEAKYQVKPDTVSQNIVVDSWCKSGRLDAPENVMRLLTTMENEFKAGKTSMKPDGYTYSSVIGCYIKFGRKDAHKTAEKILHRMLDLYQNHGGNPASPSVYNAVINAWASSDSKHARKRVKELLDVMEGSDDPSIPKPNRITYNTVIKAMRDGSADDAEYAMRILTKLEEEGQTYPHMLPDSYSYTSVITAYGRSSSENKAEKAFEILERMILACNKGNMAAKPTTHSYNAALNACAFAGGTIETKVEAFDTAMKIYNLLKENEDPDQTSYGTILRACAALLPVNDAHRKKFVEDFFYEACATGSVGRLVLTQMKYAATPEQFSRLLGKEILERVTTRELPKSWTRNVRENSRR